MEGATPNGEGRWCEFTGAPPPPARWRTSGKKHGVAPSTSSPSRAAPSARPASGDKRVRRRTALYRRGLGQSVPTCVQCEFPGTAWTTTARAAPSDSADLQLSKSCTTCMRHPRFVRWPPIRRHRRDPQRRKSSIDPALAETAMAFDGGPVTPAFPPLWQGSAFAL